jgi:hypothetical protein
VVDRQPDAAHRSGGVSKFRLKVNLNWTFGGSGYRHVWVHGTAACSSAPRRKPTTAIPACSASAPVAPGDYFELVARQTSGSTKNVAADDLTWFAIEVVE